MALVHADLRSIVARSSTMSERIAGAFTPAAGGPRAPVAARIERLKRRVAGGDPVRFARYLRARAWDQAVLVRALGAVDCSGDALPDWSLLLLELGAPGVPADAAVRLDAAEKDDSRAPEPFEEALDPFIALARRRLAARARPERMLTPAACDDLERGLRRTLSRLAGRTLLAELGGFRAGLARQPQTADTSVYDRFLAQLRNGGLDRVLRDYPVLARLLALRVQQWVDASAELLDRLERDAPVIGRAWNGGAPLGQVAAFATDLSDPHRGGRSVSALTFACGLRIVYKPRPLAIEAAFAALIAWLNARRLSVSLRAPEAIDRGDYGWMAFAEAAPCADAEAAERYYRRAGMLLCLAYVLGGSDLHHGNVIACGEHPALIDLEAFIGAPRQPDTPRGLGHDPESQQVWDSVFRTGLVPVHRLGLRGRHQRDGGLAMVGPNGSRQVPQWHRINTDAMTMALGPPVLPRANVPVLAGVPVAAEAYADAVADGFTEMAERLRAERTALVAPRGPLGALRHVRTRVVLRDTSVYATLLEQGLHPRRLRDGADWSLDFELLKASATREDATPRSWDTGLAEERALVRLDVPLFTALSTTTAIEADDGVTVGDALAESGFDGLLARLARLDAARTRVHVHSLRLALRPSAPPASASASASASANACVCVCECNGASADGVACANVVTVKAPHRDGECDPVRVSARCDTAVSWRAEAEAIAQRLQAAAEASTDDGLRWVGIRGRRGSTQRRVQDVGWDLYGGRCGIALLFAALERRAARGAPSYAERILAPLAEDLHAGRGLGRRLASGDLGAFGCGGVVYGLTVAATLLRSDALRAAAVRAVAALTVAALDADRRFDIMSGTAGAMLALLALARVAEPRDRDWLLARAHHAGRHLLAHASLRGLRDPRPAWRTLDERAIEGGAPEGFAHGAAGIGFALARLYAQTGVTAYRTCALAALASGPQDEDARAPMEAMRESWCQGSAGLAIARIASAAALDRADLRAAGLARLAAIAHEDEAIGLSRWDMVCCGNTGRVAALSMAARLAGEHRWSHGASREAARVLARARERGSYALGPVDDVFCPGFYQGLAGVGYEWLRLDDPDLPAVLTWE